MSVNILFAVKYAFKLKKREVEQFHREASSVFSASIMNARSRMSRSFDLGSRSSRRNENKKSTLKAPWGRPISKPSNAGATTNTLAVPGRSIGVRKMSDRKTPDQSSSKGREIKQHISGNNLQAQKSDVSLNWPSAQEDSVSQSEDTFSTSTSEQESLGQLFKKSLHDLTRH